MRTVSMNEVVIDADVLSIDYGKAEVINYHDWFRNAPNPNFYGQEEHYTTVQIKLLVEAESLAALETKCSRIVSQFRQGIMTDSHVPFSLDGFIVESEEDVINSKARELSIKFQGIKVGEQTTISLNCTYGKEVAFEVNGTTNTPAKFTITPDMEYSTLAMYLNGNGYSLKGLNAGIPIIVDSKEGYVLYQGINGIDHYGSWSLPVLQGGTNTIKFLGTAAVTIEYAGRWL